MAKPSFWRILFLRQRLMPSRAGRQIFRFMDLSCVLRRSNTKNEDRYFFIINGSGRSYDADELLKLRNMITAELYRIGRLKDHTKRVNDWNAKNRNKKRAASLRWYYKHRKKAHDYYINVTKPRIEERKAIAKRAAEARKIKDINAIVITVGGTHEVPKAETKGTLPAN